MDESGSSDETVTPPPGAEIQPRDQIPFPYQVLNAAGDVLTVNDAWLECLGFDRESVEGTWFGEFLAPESVERFESTLSGLSGAGTSETVELELVRADGDAVVGSFRWRVASDEDAAGRVHGQFHDVTERTRRAEDLQRKARAVDEAPIGVTISDPTRDDNPLVYVNDRFTEMTGYTAEAALGRNCRFLQGEQTDPETVATIREAIDSESPVTVELRNYRKDGTLFWNRLSVAPLTDEDGTVTNFVGFQEDVTERRERAKELEDVVEGVPHPLYVLDVEDYRVRLSNSRAAGFEGQTCYERTHHRQQPCHEGEGTTFPCPLREVVDTGEPTTVEHTHYDADGDERTHEVHAAPVFDEEGNVVRMVESLFDVTDRRAYEQRLKEQRDNLDVLNQVLRHDIRNDLQLVTAYADLLAENVDEDQREHVEKVLESALHAVELTTTARDMADVMLSQADAHKPMGLRTVLETELDEVRSTGSEAVITVDGTIPEIDVHASEMLGSVFRNLLKNGIQHNDKRLAELTVAVREADDRAVVRIADNGPGIPDDQKDMIFGKGEKGLESSGTGLGLYLVKTLIEDYGGDVWVEDNDPEGAVFVLTLPIAE